MKIFKESSTKYKTITLDKVIDIDNHIEDLIKYVDKNSRGGHSFRVVVDPGSENEKEFYIDGDGSDRLGDISIETINEE